MTKLVSQTLALTCALACVLAASSALAQAVTWEHQYDGNVHANDGAAIQPDNAAWAEGGFGGSGSSDGDIFTFTNTTGSHTFTAGGVGGSSLHDNNVATGSTYEYRMRQVSGWHDLVVSLGDSTHSYEIIMDANTGLIGSDDGTANHIMDATARATIDWSQFHTVRLVLGDNTVTNPRPLDVYIDNNAIPAFSGVPIVFGQAFNRVTWPDTGGSAFDGESRWDYIYWTNSEGMPAPEPSSLVLLCMGLVGLSCFRR